MCFRNMSRNIQVELLQDQIIQAAFETIFRSDQIFIGIALWKVISDSPSSSCKVSRLEMPAKLQGEDFFKFWSEGDHVQELSKTPK